MYLTFFLIIDIYILAFDAENLRVRLIDRRSR